MFGFLSLLLMPLIGAINSQSFPETLSPEEEHELLIKAENKDLDARNKLVEHNLRLVAHIVKKI